MPTTNQIDANKDTANFDPVLGGGYRNGTPYSEATYGYWWGSEAYNGALRYYLDYHGSNLYTSHGRRHNGIYIRCVSEEKTVLDLTYMQDMTLSISSLLPPPRL